MKRKVIAAVVYAATAFALASFFDALYGAGPVTRGLWLIHLAIAGTILFAAACIVSLFALRAGILCAIAGGILSWPEFADSFGFIPWRHILSILPYANWLVLLTAIFALIVSSAYSIDEVSLLFRIRNHTAWFRFGTALVYAVGVFIADMWPGVEEWLIRFRYRS